ncbi:hypothetical protein NL61_04 [Pseudomonas phage Pf-10]|uniref:Uncharacterized protein n=1 Tax=Pseudomonas phage Pf-10 TaxID=1562076 RepID=A0A0A0YV70_9CAUD|nr:hypothetical protein NL61_04 [Pseudomonas phage Pf-10]AIX12966.1 hypothetical protein NL61_04 [Pseudomonas phage Pf-10]
MPKPNKYNGDGSLKPGRNVGPEPHLSAVHADYHTGQYVPLPDLKGGFMKSASRVLLYVLIVAMIGALLFSLTGCQVNVVNVIHSDIGLDTSSTVQALVE